MHRDELVEDNRILTEANRRYHIHTTELKERLEALIVSSLKLILLAAKLM